MNLDDTTLIWLPIGLGLLGFVEPCTVGGHLIFLRSLGKRPLRERIGGLSLFVIVRTVTIGVIGAFAALLGTLIVGAQTTVWLVFGSAYTLVGLAYLLGRARLVKVPVNLAPASWRTATGPAVLGAAFGLNIPACAAPILFGLFGLAAGSGSFLMGFAAMALFGLALSAPLVLFVVQPTLAILIEKLFEGGPRMTWILGAVFVVLGLWSIWFGLFVDPTNWAQL